MSIAREPATLWIGLVAPIVAALAAFVFAANPDLQGVINAAAVAVAGAITAFLVRSDNLLPAITGAIQALRGIRRSGEPNRDLRGLRTRRASSPA